MTQRLTLHERAQLASVAVSGASANMVVMDLVPREMSQTIRNCHSNPMSARSVVDIHKSVRPSASSLEENVF